MEAEEEETFPPEVSAPPPPHVSPNVDSSSAESTPRNQTKGHHTRSRRQIKESAQTILPLRQQPPRPGEARPFLTYTPFSTTDLYNWKLQNPPFSEKPQALISLLETVFVTTHLG